MRRNRLYHLIMSMLIIMLLSCGAAFCEQRVVKVGATLCESYINADSDGSYSGYAVDYLDDIAKITDWKYEYVAGSVADLYKKALDGEIDILPAMFYTEERARSLLFPKRSNCVVFTSLFTAVNSPLRPNDFKAFNGITIGLVAGARVNATDLAEYARINEFTYNVKYYSGQAEMSRAVVAHEIDAAALGFYQYIEGTRPLGKFAPRPVYFAVSKKSPEILTQLDEAQDDIQKHYPNHDVLLFEKHDKSGESLPALSDEEKAYMNSMPTLRVVYCDSWMPLGYTDKDTGEFVGIVAELFNTIAYKTGINFVYVRAPNDSEAQKMLADGKADAIAAFHYDLETAGRRGLTLTQPYISVPFMLINDEYANPNTGKFAVTSYYLKYNYLPNTDGKKPVLFETSEECLEALRDGEVDIAFINSYSAAYLMQLNRYNRFSRVALQAGDFNICMALRSGVSPAVLTLMNNSIRTLSSMDLNGIIIRNLSAVQELSIGNLFERVPVDVALLMAGVVFACLLLTLMLVYSARSRHREATHAKELSRFISYVYRTNAKVYVVNLADKTRYAYKINSSGTAIREKNKFSIGPIDKTHPDDAEKMASYFSRDALEKLIDEVGNEYFEIRVMVDPDAQNDDEKYHWFAYSLQGISRDASSPSNYIVFKRDIDSAKREEARQRRLLSDALMQARTASMAKGEFLSHMSHEIRTPLNAIIGYLAIAKCNMDSIDKLRDCVLKSDTASSHLLSIINDVLDMSSIESGKMKLALKPFDFRAMITEMTDILAAQAKNRGLDFKVTLKNVTEEKLIGDKLRLSQILMNLLSNSLKFTPRGGSVTLSIIQAPLHESRIHMVFKVSDTGVGMTQEFLSRMFQPFVQEDATVAQNFGGSGLGLSITKTLVDMMDGVISVKSEKGKGSTFTFNIPFQRDESEEHTEQKKKRPYNFSHARVLVADDDNDTCEYMQMVLQRCGVRSSLVVDGENAVATVREAHAQNDDFNLCFIDWKMPRMDGVETVRRIRAEIGEDVQVIIITSYNISDMEEEALKAGANRVMAKPLFQSTLINLMIELFGKSTMKPTPRASGASYDFSGMRLLLAEDNEMNLEIAEELLRGMGFIVDCARDGREAFDMFMKSERGTYAVVLMDIQMPIMNGYEATRTIRASSHPEAATIPILAMTANAFAEDVSRAINAGMNGHIAKPVDVKQLQKTLNNCISSIRGGVM